MAKNSSGQKRGNYLRKIGFYDVYCKFTYVSDKGTKKKVSGHSLDIYHAKKLIKGGFKTIDQVTEHVKTLA